MKRGLLYLSLAIMVALYFGVALICIALFSPIKTLEITNYADDRPLPVENKTLHPGDPLTYQLDYCKYRDTPSTVHRQLIDGQVITLQDTVGRLQAGCHTVLVRTAVIPETINPGRYYLDVKVDYAINPLRDLFIGPTRTHYRTEYFDVVAPVQKAKAIIYGQSTVIYVQPLRTASTTAPSIVTPDTLTDYRSASTTAPSPTPTAQTPNRVSIPAIIDTVTHSPWLPQ